MESLEGVLVGHPDGFAFVVVDDPGQDDLFLPRHEASGAMHRDRVRVLAGPPDRRGRRRAHLDQVVAHNTEELVGELRKAPGYWEFFPEDKRYTNEILIAEADVGQARDGDLVRIKLLEYPRAHTPALGSVVQVFGQRDEAGMAVELAIHRFELPNSWSEGVQQQIAELPTRVDGDAILRQQGSVRTDLRQLPLVTIDGEDARDFDDAVHCETLPDGWRLTVAIADVAHYVPLGSPLDEAARDRATSVYFPAQVLPMLPEVLSNGLCSLRPDEDRLATVCRMRIDAMGEVVEYEFLRAVIRSRARLTYTQVQQWLDSGQGLPAGLDEHIAPLAALHEALREARARRGVVEFASLESVVRFGEQGEVVALALQGATQAHAIIEECMIAANRCAAEYLSRHGVPALYRVHEAPDDLKLAGLRTFLMEFGLTLEGGAAARPEDFRQLLEAARERPDFHVIQMAVLRSFKRAAYAVEDLGHFGISVPNYCHFTSPIRRYPDLTVHRALIHLLAGGKVQDYQPDAEAMEQIAEHCSMAERRADEAVYDVIAYYKCCYMERHLGDHLDGYVTGVTRFGLFVTIDTLLVDGLVHITDLGDDYHELDAERHRLVGRRSGRIFRLGDKLRVQVARVAADERKIDFVPVPGRGSARE